MVAPCDTYCPITGILHSTLTTRGCPHCLLDLKPDLGPLPSSIPIKQESLEHSSSKVKKEVHAIDLTSPKKPTTSKPSRFNSYIANRSIVEATRQSGFKNTGKAALKASISGSISNTISPSTIIPKPGGEIRSVTIVVGPYMGSQRDYLSIGVSTYTFHNRQEVIPNWPLYIKDHILPNHVGWNDHKHHNDMELTIKRYQLATQWSKTRGPTYLSK